MLIENNNVLCTFSLDIVTYNVFKRELGKAYLTRQADECSLAEDEHICNYSCIESVVNNYNSDSS